MSKLRNPIKNILNQTFPDREQKREDSFRGEAGPAAGGGGGQTAEFQLKYRPHYSHGNFPTFFKRGSWQGPGVRTNGECRRKQGPRAEGRVCRTTGIKLSISRFTQSSATNKSFNQAVAIAAVGVKVLVWNININAPRDVLLC